MKNFRTFEIADKFYQECKELGLKGEIGDQLNRASLSVVLNLAEGRGKRTTKDQVKFFYIALGSVRECQAIFYIERLFETAAWELLDSLGAHVFCLIREAK